MGTRVVRVPGWEELLAAEIEAARNQPFAWHEHDCASFAARCVHVITGVDHFEKYRATYADAEAAAKVLRSKRGLRSIVVAAFGHPVPFAHAQRGDLVLVEMPSPGGRFVKALAVVLGPFAAAPGPDGLVFVPTSQWRSAWKV